MDDHRKEHLLKEKSRVYFNAVAAADEQIPEPVLCYAYVMDRLRPVEGGRLADIGCGTGEMLLRILRELDGRFVLHGMDLSEESLMKAAEKCGDGAEFVRADAEELPYPDGSMDVLLCMHSFHHYPHPAKALREMHRVLSPGGCLILVENLYSFYRQNRMNLGLLLRGHPNGDIRMYSRADLARRMKRAGFRVEEHTAIADHSQLLVCRK